VPPDVSALEDTPTTSIDRMTNAKKNWPDPSTIRLRRQPGGFGRNAASGVHGRSAMPFKATGHKGGISRQGSKRG